MIDYTYTRDSCIGRPKVDGLQPALKDRGLSFPALLEENNRGNNEETLPRLSKNQVFHR